MISPILPLRIAQGVLSIITLGCAAAVVHAFDNVIDNSSPDSLSFLIFCCVWTWLALVYLVAVPQFLPAFHNQWAVLGVEVVTMIFWFCGFVSWAAFIGDRLYCTIGICATAKAAAAFGAFMWLLFVGSLVLVIRSLWMQRKQGDAPNPSVAPAFGAQHQMESQNPGFNPSETPKPYEQPYGQPQQHTQHSTAPQVVGNEYSGAQHNTYDQSAQPTPYTNYTSEGQPTPMPQAGGYGGQESHNYGR